MRISKGILLHWNPVPIENWILHSLPKLQFIIENNWFGEYESAVILPYSDIIKEYTELLMMEKERIIWMKQNQVFLVKELTLMDYRPVNQKIAIGNPHPPASLLNSVRLGLIGEEWNLENQDVIMIVRDPTIPRSDSINLVNYFTEIVDNLFENNQIPNAYTVIELDINSDEYRIMFAFKRSR